MSRSARWFALYEEGLDQGLQPEQAAAYAINAESDLLADLADYKYQQMKDERNGHS